MEPRRLALEQLSEPAGGPGWTYMPFAAVNGFTTHWWHRQVIGEPDEWFAFRDLKGEELVRAEVDPHSTAAENYQGVLVPDGGFAQITFFEVRDNNRRKHLGAEAIDLLGEIYQGRQLAAFSEQADYFWASLGWTPHRPHLGPDDYEGHYQTFYTAPILRPGPAEGATRED